MASFKKRYDADQKKKVLDMLKELQVRIQKGDLVVDTFGQWQGQPGNWTFKVSVKESEKSQLF